LAKVKQLEQDGGVVNARGSGLYTADS
jgi:hypothetical protein